jgi:hypothetical protein
VSHDHAKRPASERSPRCPGELAKEPPRKTETTRSQKHYYHWSETKQKHPSRKSSLPPGSPQRAPARRHAGTPTTHLRGRYSPTERRTKKGGGAENGDRAGRPPHDTGPPAAATTPFR